MGRRLTEDERLSASEELSTSPVTLLACVLEMLRSSIDAETLLVSSEDREDKTRLEVVTKKLEDVSSLGESASLDELVIRETKDMLVDGTVWAARAEVGGLDGIAVIDIVEDTLTLFKEFNDTPEAVMPDRRLDELEPIGAATRCAFRSRGIAGAIEVDRLELDVRRVLDLRDDVVVARDVICRETVSPGTSDVTDKLPTDKDCEPSESVASGDAPDLL